MPLVLILASACSGGSPDPSGESDGVSNAFSVTDALQPDGPLRGIAFTGHVNRESPKVRPTLTFTTQDAEVTAVIGLADLDEGSTVVVSWYRVAGLEEREALFTHEIAVGPGGGQAFSQAVAPTGLAPGIYDTEATMDGYVVHTPWVVREAVGSETGATAQAASGDEDWNVPDAGDSWWDEFGGEPPPLEEGQADTCTFDIIYPGTVPLQDVKARAVWVGPCTTGTLTATVSGPPTTLASSDDLEALHNHLYGQVDVCSLAGGTDMPGTVVHFEATGSANGSEDFTLPDLGEVLLADLEGIPEAGSHVEPGDRIAIHAIAFVMPPALGVRTLYVDDGSDLLESVGNRSGSDQPVACDPRRMLAELVTEYIVPADAPPVIELCATGVGFDGTESKNCIRYYTGEVWEGTIDSTVTTPPPGGPCGNPVDVRGTVQLVVAEDGSVTGTYDVTGCGVSEPHAEFTGTVTDAGFLFPQLVVTTNGSPIPKTSPTHAEATLTNMQGPSVTWVTTWDLTCVTCEG